MKMKASEASLTVSRERSATLPRGARRGGVWGPSEGPHRDQNAPVSFEGTAQAGPELLRSPISGQPCVHWRLRIVERLTPRTQLVHEMASPEAFELTWAGSGEDGRAAVRIRLDPQAARIH